jgi:hypothetical protein
MDATMNVTPRLTQRAISTVGLFTIVGTLPPILKSILANAAIYPIGVPAVRVGAVSGRPVRPSCM